MNLIKSFSAEAAAVNHTTILLPVGSLEQHGTEAPLGCDGLIAEALCLRAGHLTSTAVLPTLFYGCSASHRAFPGTFSLSEETYSALISEIINEAARNGFKHILLLSGHGGNRKAAEKALTQAESVIRTTYMGYWQLPGVQEMERRLFGNSGYHVTTSEVSMVWHILNGTIPGAFTGVYPPAVKDISEISPLRWKELYPDGGVGADLSRASVSRGKNLFNFVADALAAFLVSVSSDDFS